MIEFMKTGMFSCNLHHNIFIKVKEKLLPHMLQWRILPPYKSKEVVIRGKYYYS